MTKIKWLSAPEQHDYPAAASYLSLLLRPKEVDDVIDRLQNTDVTVFWARDILRAAKLKALGADNRHVASDLKKIRNGESLSPIILIRGDHSTSVLLTIADGYHRASAASVDDEDIEVAGQIVGLS
jgi:hypothetical protein